ncbi:MAG: hypothetical protein H6574_19955 [Lewinellaceae bacterium]|nr:hypothetical protein [Saprospiraceae bacterium]MCB9333343.1 hypothetical protein [Lewinellaceae bacterium]
MEHLLLPSRLSVSRIKLGHQRFLHDDIRWDWRLVCYFWEKMRWPRPVAALLLR